MTRAPESWRPSDAIRIPLVVGGLILTGILERFEMMGCVRRVWRGGGK